jgi:hypothetical protein
VEASSGSEDDEPNNAPAAYNASIYLMVSMPYGLLGLFTFLVYRGLKKNADYHRALKDKPPSGSDSSDPAG